MTFHQAQAAMVPEATRDDAWASVVALERASGQRLYGYALRLGIDRARSSDLVQEALIRLWRELRKGTMVNSPEAWAFRTIARLAMDEHRLHRRLATLIDRLAERTVPRVTEVDATDRLAVWSQVDRLPDRQRQAIYLRYQADLSFEEVAAIMGISESAARSHASQAMATLRTKLSDLGR
jgi:RNA polymerase sigma factor (sigma-70 family)